MKLEKKFEKKPPKTNNTMEWKCQRPQNERQGTDSTSVKAEEKKSPPMSRILEINVKAAHLRNPSGGDESASEF